MSEPTGEHIHHADDGRGARRIYVDGQYYPQAFWIDIQLGLVVTATDPVKTTEDGKRIDSYPVWGDVLIETVDQQ